MTYYVISRLANGDGIRLGATNNENWAVKDALEAHLQAGYDTEVRREDGSIVWASKFPGKDWDKQTSEEEA